MPSSDAFFRVQLSTHESSRHLWLSSWKTNRLPAALNQVDGDSRLRSRELLGLKRSQCGAVTFVQRFNSALGLNVHFHLIGLDGVYAAGPDGAPEFHELPAPEDQEVLEAVSLIAGRVEGMIERRGLEDEGPDAQH